MIEWLDTAQEWRPLIATVIGVAGLLGMILIRRVNAFAALLVAALATGLIPDTVEYGQYANGRRDEGAVFGSSLFVQKASSALTGLGIGYLLSGIGYEADRDMQTSETANALGHFVALVPPVFLILASITLLLMPLTRDLHARIVDELSS